MLQFEDISWDEFCQSDDHIVPYPRSEKACANSFLGERCKKTRCKELDVLDHCGDRSACKTVCDKEMQDLPVMSNKRKTILEKDPWLQTTNDICPSPCADTVKEVSSFASDSTRMSTHYYGSNNMESMGSEFSAADAILGNKSAAVDSNSYDYPLGQISQTDNDLSFFDNNHKDSSDFLYYGWPEIGNFEDVDRIFRSCDSTFGLGTSNEDEMGWFSSSEAVEGSGDALQSDFKFPCADSTTVGDNSENCEALRINNPSIKNASLNCRDGPWLEEKNKCDNIGHLSFLNGASSSDSKGDSIPVEQGLEYESDVQHKIPSTNHSTNGSSRMMNANKKQPKHQNKSDGKRKDQCIENEGSFYYSNGLPKEDSKPTSAAASSEALRSIGGRQQNHALGPESFGYLHSNMSYMPSNYNHPSDQSSLYPTLSALRSDNNGYTSVSPKESYSSNQVLSAESSLRSSFQMNPIVSNKKTEKLQGQQVLQSTLNIQPESMNIVQFPFYDPVSFEKKAQHSKHMLENCGDAGLRGELASSAVQESPSASSVLNDISLEAASFRQLQLVMEKLDLRTKLCIRDSLYRLARSAEQRHNHEKMNGRCCGDERDCGGALLSERANECTGFMDIETDTNPIDRSIAHLLFHRPSDSTEVPAQDSLSYKTPTLIHGSISSPPMMGDDLINDETAAVDTETKVADH